MESLDHMPQYGFEHISMLLLAIALSAISIPLFRARPHLLKYFGWVLLSITVLWTAWGFLPVNYTIEQSWPLHFSDALRVISSIALITRAKWATSITILWGLTINMMSLLTPDLGYISIPWLEFTAYWALHILVCVAAVVLLSLGESPGFQGTAITLAFTVTWGLLCLVFNSMSGANYGYLSHAPVSSSILDYLGGWPSYIVVEVLILGAVWTLITYLILKLRIPYTPKTRKGTAKPSSVVSASGIKTSGLG